MSNKPSDFSDKPKETLRESINLVAEQLIDGRYKIVSTLGSGGMGCVYRVTHLMMQKDFALKTLNANFSDRAWSRFKQESQALQRLDHPGLVQVHDVGMIEGKQPYFVMDLCEGETLHDLIKKNGAVPLATAISIFTEVCAALGYAHLKGVVHRDMKPSNIMVQRDSTTGDIKVKVVDFGIAKLSQDTEQAALTQSGDVFGTPYYMSPEQCRSLPADARSDIYSLGCVMFETLTSLPPFLGDTALSIMLQHETDYPQKMSDASLGNAVPAALESVVSKMMEKSPDDRYQSLLDVERDLDLVRRGLAVDAKPSSRRTAAGAPKQEPKKFQWTTPKVVGLCAAVLLIALATSFIVNNKVQVPRQSPPVTVAQSDITLSTPDASVEFLGAEKPKDFYSIISPEGTRTFNFPTKIDIGKLVDLGPFAELTRLDTEHTSLAYRDAALGKVVIKKFEPFGLLLTEEACEHPELLKYFRPDEVKSITFPNTFAARDAHLDAMRNWTSLESLVGNQSSITLSSVPILNGFSRLKQLNIGEAQLPATELKELHSLPKLTSLGIGQLLAGPAFLKDFRSTELRQLDLRHGAFTGDDLKPIATNLPNLTHLDLAYCRKVQAKAIGYLTPLKHLKELNLEADVQITPTVIPFLKAFPDLKTLTITTSTWSESERATLVKALPNCKIIQDDKVW